MNTLFRKLSNSNFDKISLNYETYMNITFNYEIKYFIFPHIRMTLFFINYETFINIEFNYEIL